MTAMDALHEKWMRKPEYRQAYNALEEEFALAAATGARLKISFEPRRKTARGGKSMTG